MQGELIAIDLETTGLDPESDAIIEFAAVRIHDGVIVERYATLINPLRPVPIEVTQLTGIKDEDFLPRPGIAGSVPAPHLAQAIPGIVAFVGDTPIVGHNIGFDMAFLHRARILKSNALLDTYELASVLVPQAQRYNLAWLCSYFQIELSNHHRALADAEAAALLYRALWNRAIRLPAPLLKEIASTSKHIAWGLRSFFDAAHQNHIPVPIAEGLSAAESPIASPSLLHSHSQADWPSMAALFGPGGSAVRSLPHFQAREQQTAFAQAVASALEDDHHLLAESATGTGKTLGYLVPAALWSLRQRQPVVISTHTVHLQEQILIQEKPLAEQITGKPFLAAILKGRQHYLCQHRLQSIRQREARSLDELRILAKVLVWETEDGSGDRSKLNLRGPVEQLIWTSFSAEAENCSGERCEADAQGRCALHLARQRALAAQVVIVNHALLAADAVARDPIIPSYRYVILDEAHNLEEGITSALSEQLDENILLYQLLDLSSSQRGLLGGFLASLQEALGDKADQRLAGFVADVVSVARAAEEHVHRLFNALRGFLKGGSDGDAVFALRLTDKQRRQQSFAPVVAAHAPLDEFLDGLITAIKQLERAARRAPNTHRASVDSALQALQAARARLESIRELLRMALREPSPDKVIWLSQPGNTPIIRAAPLHTGSFMEQYLWNARQSVILTSSTLQVNGDFNHIQQRLHGEGQPTASFASPFNYRDAVLILIPNDVPDPNERGKYQQAVERCLVELASVLEGRTLALFTSYAQLQQTALAIRPRLALGGITLYDQLDTISRQQAVDGFKAAERAVLMGTRSFWEGIDIPGPSLSALVITRLPFPVPTEPVFSARSEAYQDAFNEYTLPDAILRFRQGFGRLIRHEHDRGVVVILDRRLTNKNYGQDFLNALPNCTIQHGTLGSMADAARRWIGEGPRSMS